MMQSNFISQSFMILYKSRSESKKLKLYSDPIVGNVLDNITKSATKY